MLYKSLVPLFLSSLIACGGAADDTGSNEARVLGEVVVEMDPVTGQITSSSGLRPDALVGNLFEYVSSTCTGCGQVCTNGASSRVISSRVNVKTGNSLNKVRISDLTLTNLTLQGNAGASYVVVGSSSTRNTPGTGSGAAGQVHAPLTAGQGMTQNTTATVQNCSQLIQVRFKLCDDGNFGSAFPKDGSHTTPEFVNPVCACGSAGTGGSCGTP